MGMTQTTPWVQCGREFSAEEIRQVCETVTWLGRLSRKELSATVCEHLEWHTASGTPKLQACEKLLEKLEAAGRVALPAKPVARARSRRDIRLSARTEAGAPVTGRLRELGAVRLEPVTEPEAVGLWNEYVERYHPLGYKGVFGYRLRYFIYADALILGCVLLGGGAKAMTVRDSWIGWSARMRLRNLPWVIGNTRFLVFPWVRVPHLASHALGHLARRVAADWQRYWGFTPVLMETFVDPQRFVGSCYRAAGWELLGETTGSGLARPGKHYRTHPRLVFVKPLVADFRQRLCATPLAGKTPT